MKVTINLLPEGEKDKVRAQRLTGMVLRVGFSAIMSIVVFAAFLSSCLFIMSLQDKIIINESIQLKNDNVYSEIQKMYDVVDKYYKNTQRLDKSMADQVSNIAILEEVNNLMPNDVFLQEISIADGSLVMSGFSSNRDSLLDFRDKLEASGLFESVEAPISNFTSSENINFNFTVGIKK